MMAKREEVLEAEASIKRFITDLNCLCERHNLIIDKDTNPAFLRVYRKYGYNEVGKIEYDEINEHYQEYLSLTQREIRDEIKSEIKDKNFLNVLNNLKKWQEEFLEEVVGKHPKIVSEEEELIYLVALDKIEDEFKDYKMWNKLKHHPEEYQWKKIDNLYWQVVAEEGEVIIEVTKEDVCRYVDDEVLEQHYSKYL